jgi:hypothetical protein
MKSQFGTWCILQFLTRDRRVGIKSRRQNPIPKDENRNMQHSRQQQNAERYINIKPRKQSFGWQMSPRRIDADGGKAVVTTKKYFVSQSTEERKRK